MRVDERILHYGVSMKTASLLCALAFAACTSMSSTSSESIHFSAERVSPGVYRLALDNGTDHQIGYNLCPSVLERRTGSEWTPVSSNEVCTMQLAILNPGADATLEKRPGALAAGEYRYVTRVESPLQTPQTTVATAPFTVR